MEAQKVDIKRITVEELHEACRHDFTLLGKEIERLNKKVNFLMKVQCERINEECKERGQYQ